VAWLWSELGREAEARAEFEALATNGFVDLPRNGNWFALIGFLARTCAFLGDAPRAAVLFDLLSPYPDRIAVGGTSSARFDANASALGVLAATLARWDDAVSYFERALEQNASTPWIVVTIRDYASLLLDPAGPGDRDRARRLLDEGIATAERCAMVALGQHLVALRGRA
jgi:tetratricopeptide (TPR) repeat protein